VYSQIPCAVDQCPNLALYSRDTCYPHLEDKSEYQSQIRELFATERVFRNLELSGIALEDMELTDKEFWFCNLSHVRFSRVKIQQSVFRLTYFDFAHLIECGMTECDARLSAFAGSHLTEASFTESEMPRCNFVGITAKDSLFEALDLYDCRFTNSRLENTRFSDCNVKRVDFQRSKLDRVSFSNTNVEESHLDKVERKE
jgi:uncharacterized protein YjbI with pentapeptide repeats